MTEVSSRRGVLARIGISALNVLLPGLGLVRLARYRQAIIVFLIVSASMLVLLGGFYVLERITFGEWAAVVGTVLALTLIACLGSIVASWRASETLEERGGYAWRWYGVVAIWAISVLVTWSVGDVGRTRYRGFYAAGEAMLPTMQVNDRFLADMHEIGPLERGDLVIAHTNGEDWAKRVVGLPGDSIALFDGTVILNGKPMVQQVAEKTRFRADWGDQEAIISREQFPGEARAHLVMDTGPSALDNFSGITLPPDRYFLLGDNRDHSADSRMPPGEEGLGLVARTAISGRIVFRYWRDGVGIGPGQD